ncbi:MAG: ribulose-phosphate 3-epimerase [Alphaproteobacteria bacterium]|nr:ribulose-phosphate 3-epimerase [Alphaproteobacteria bacterium]
MVLVSPSILSADFSSLGKEIKALNESGADLIHIDVMDGVFVPNLTFGAPVVKSIRSCSSLPFDVHLMVEKPSVLIQDFIDAGADFITIHLECKEEIPYLISLIKKGKKKVGISIKPNTKVSDILPYIPDIDLILVMSVEPGFGGQQFQQEAIKKIADLKELIGKKKVLISVDGGINDITAPACVYAGADILVAGSYIFKNKPYKKAISKLKG